MSQKQHITDVLMVGATGSIGRLAVEAAQRHGLRPRALVRDVRRAERLLPGVELVRGEHGSVDGVLDPSDLPVEAEPQAVRVDLDTVLRSYRGTSG
jgi:short subunit dehydrogenase-like uncharacterized protein